ncbi:hypothetical protein Pcac1_g28382 [Phytophthora cactorum]|nr:hypothetical protein Pcac1_g28382 [Phytophthora cactorum]
MDWTAAWLDEETKESEPPAAAPVSATEAVRDPANTVDDLNGEWLLRFDGACRANPGPGGAGAALFQAQRPRGVDVFPTTTRAATERTTRRNTPRCCSAPGPQPTTA